MMLSVILVDLYLNESRKFNRTNPMVCKLIVQSVVYLLSKQKIDSIDY